MPGPLDGVRVLSFGRALAGPFASMLLCDLGAEVVKIEDPDTGDFTRAGPPYVEGISAYFNSVNRGKRSLTLNLREEKGRGIALALAKKVDILLENFRPGVMARLGLDYETVRKHNPRIIYASISGFGQSGPYAHRPAFDMIAQGMGGVASITGEPGRPPVRVGYSIGDMGASLFATVAVLAALHEREKSGEGQWIDVAMLDSQVALCENACAGYFATGNIPGPLGSRHPMVTPFQIFPTRDGYIVLIAFRDEDWRKFCEAAGKEEWIEDERFGSVPGRLQNYDLYIGQMNALMQTRSTGEWLNVLSDRGVMCGPVNNIEQVVNDPHVRARDMILELEHNRVGKLKGVGTPMKFSRTPCSLRKASPDLGEHTIEILSGWLGLSDEAIRRLREAKVI